MKLRENISTERLQKLQRVLEKRQYDITLVLEHVHDPHNISAVMRSCDAVGVQVVHIIPQPDSHQNLGKKSSASASKWLDIIYHEDIESCIKSLKKEGFQILSSKLDSEMKSVDLYSLNFNDKLALIFGNEHEGVSNLAVELADGNFHIPQFGIIESLNISVAAAVSLYEALRQRRIEGHYNISKSNQKRLENKLIEWSHK